MQMPTLQPLHRSALCLAFVLSLLLCGKPCHAAAQFDVRAASWGMGIDDVKNSERIPPISISKENVFGMEFDVLVYETQEETNKIHIIYCFFHEKLKSVIIEIFSQSPTEIYKQLVQYFHGKYRRHKDIEAPLKRIQELIQKYKKRGIPPEALAVLDNPEITSGLAAFENERTIIQIPFRHRADASVITVNYLDKAFWNNLLATGSAAK